MESAIYERSSLFINGKWAPAGGGVQDIVNPATELPIGHAPVATPSDVNAAVEAARAAFDHGSWSRTTVAERAGLLMKLYELYAAKADVMASLITAEMGSPITYSRTFQVAGGLIALTAAQAQTYPFDEVRHSDYGDSLIVRDPVGVVGAIVPWNFPQATTVMKLAPALLAGCTVVVKSSPETALDSLLLADLCEQVGFPPGVVNFVPGDRDAGAALVAHPGVDKIAFTGSTAAGKTIAAACALDMKRTTLELGGKSAAIVLDDADITTTVRGISDAMWANGGQVCSAQTRMLVSRSRYQEFSEAMVEFARGLQVGDPTDPKTIVGPMVSKAQRDRVMSYIECGADQGAKIAIGGGTPAEQERGWFVEPTIFVDADNSMRIAQEEIFGPVLVMIPYDDPDHAVAIANDSDFGLSGSVWTSDVDSAKSVARRVRTGGVRINGSFGSPESPFGGYKRSGIGRELGPEGVSAYVEMKSIGMPTSD